MSLIDHLGYLPERARPTSAYKDDSSRRWRCPDDHATLSRRFRDSCRPRGSSGLPARFARGLRQQHVDELSADWHGRVRGQQRRRCKSRCRRVSRGRRRWSDFGHRRRTGGIGWRSRREHRRRRAGRLDRPSGWRRWNRCWRRSRQRRSDGLRGRDRQWRGRGRGDSRQRRSERPSRWHGRGRRSRRWRNGRCPRVRRRQCRDRWPRCRKRGRGWRRCRRKRLGRRLGIGRHQRGR
jgi:hypothetical protein